MVVVVLLEAGVVTFGLVLTDPDGVILDVGTGDRDLARDEAVGL